MSERMYGFPIPKGSSSPLHVYSIGEIKADPGFTHTLSRLDGTTLACVVRGHGTYKVGSEAWEVGPGDVFIHHEGKGFVTIADRRKPWTRIWLWMGGRLAEELLSLYGLSQIHYLPKAGLTSRFQRALRLAAGASGTSVDQGLTEAAFGIIAAAGAFVQNQDSSLSPLVSRAKAILESETGKENALPRIAARLGCSREWLIREFKRELGVTPHEFLLTRKIERAKLLLADPSITVERVSQVLGFSDAYYFSNLFKRREGLAPAHWRENRHRLGHATKSFRIS